LLSAATRFFDAVDIDEVQREPKLAVDLAIFLLVRQCPT
jgi:hypothetical protein